MRTVPRFVLAVSMLSGALAGAEDSPFRGSSLTLRNEVSAVSFDRGAELTYDPFYALTLGFDGRYHVFERTFVRARFELARELTDSNVTTRSGETVPSDLRLSVGSDRLVEIPKVKVGLSGELAVRLPTSPASRAQTLLLGLEPTLRLGRSFPLRQGLSLRYSLAPSVYFHRYTTAERVEPLVFGCSPTDCERLVNLGARNAAWSHAHTLDAGLQVNDWLGVSAAAGVAVQVLYPASSDPSVTHAPLPPSDVRYTNVFALETAFTPMRAFSVALGASTVNPQLAPDSTRYGLFFNRYTHFYLDLRLSPDGLWARFRGNNKT